MLLKYIKVNTNDKQYRYRFLTYHEHHTFKCMTFRVNFITQILKMICWNKIKGQ